MAKTCYSHLVCNEKEVTIWRERERERERESRFRGGEGVGRVGEICSLPSTTTRLKEVMTKPPPPPPLSTTPPTIPYHTTPSHHFLPLLPPHTNTLTPLPSMSLKNTLFGTYCTSVMGGPKEVKGKEMFFLAR